MLDFVLEIAQRANEATPATENLEFVKEFYQNAWENLTLTLTLFGGFLSAIIIVFGAVLPTLKEWSRNKEFEKLKEKTEQTEKELVTKIDLGRDDAIEKAQTMINEAKKELQVTIKAAQRDSNSGLDYTKGLIALNAAQFLTVQKDTWDAVANLRVAMDCFINAHRFDRDYLLLTCLSRLWGLWDTLETIPSPYRSSYLQSLGSIIDKIKGRDNPSEEKRESINDLVSKIGGKLEELQGTTPANDTTTQASP